MNKFLLSSAVFFFSLAATIDQHPLWQPSLPKQVDFDTAMFQEIAYGKHYFSAEKDTACLEFCRQLYNKHQLCNLEPRDTAKIPKIIHQIWLGDKFPESFEPFSKTWHLYHPDWTYIFWVDNPENFSYGALVADLNKLRADLNSGELSGQHLVIDVRTIELINQDLFDAAINYGQKSDILRYEILYNLGGLYVDTDFRCLRPFDILHHCYDFFCGFSNDGLVDLNIAILGSRAEHPIMLECIEQLQPLLNYTNVWDILKNSGPKHFLKCFYDVAPDCTDTVIAFPCTFFYPLPNTQRGASAQEIQSYIQPESFAMHYWACSWMRKNAFLPEEN